MSFNINFKKYLDKPQFSDIKNWSNNELKRNIYTTKNNSVNNALKMRVYIDNLYSFLLDYIIKKRYNEEIEKITQNNINTLKRKVKHNENGNIITDISKRIAIMFDTYDELIKEEEEEEENEEEGIKISNIKNFLIKPKNTKIPINLSKYPPKPTTIPPLPPKINFNKKIYKNNNKIWVIKKNRNRYTISSTNTTKNISYNELIKLKNDGKILNRPPPPPKIYNDGYTSSESSGSNNKILFLNTINKGIKLKKTNEKENQKKGITSNLLKSKFNTLKPVVKEPAKPKKNETVVSMTSSNVFMKAMAERRININNNSDDETNEWDNQPPKSTSPIISLPPPPPSKSTSPPPPPKKTNASIQPPPKTNKITTVSIQPPPPPPKTNKITTVSIQPPPPPPKKNKITTVSIQPPPPPPKKNKITTVSIQPPPPPPKTNKITTVSNQPPPPPPKCNPIPFPKKLINSLNEFLKSKEMFSLKKMHDLPSLLEEYNNLLKSGKDFTGKKDEIIQKIDKHNKQNNKKYKNIGGISGLKTYMEIKKCGEEYYFDNQKINRGEILSYLPKFKDEIKINNLNNI
jgi:hypothetical protein